MTKNERTQRLHYLISCLQAEMPEYKKYRPSDDAAESFNLYRALCNVREPRGETMHTLPDRFYTVQAEVLRDITNEKGITDADSLPGSPVDPRLSVWQGDITTLKTDAIVNAANSQMLGCFSPLHGCIDNIIHTMAGVELREKCWELMRAQGREEPTGQAKITPGYNLPASYVIHTVGPIVTGPLTEHDEALLASCYLSVLETASANGLQSVAFCCISTGVFHFPQDKAAEIAVETVRDYLDAHPASPVKKIVFNVFKDRDLALYSALLGRS